MNFARCFNLVLFTLTALSLETGCRTVHQNSAAKEEVIVGGGIGFFGGAPQPDGTTIWKGIRVSELGGTSGRQGDGAFWSIL